MVTFVLLGEQARSMAELKFALAKSGAKCVVTSTGMTLMLLLSAGSLDSQHIVSCSCKSFTFQGMLVYMKCYSNYRKVLSIKGSRLYTH